MGKKRKKRIVALSELGKVIGEAHHEAVLTDEQVEHVRDVYEEGLVGYRSLQHMCTELWGVTVTRATIQWICTYRSRSVYPASYKTIED